MFTISDKLLRGEDRTGIYGNCGPPCRSPAVPTAGRHWPNQGHVSRRFNIAWPLIAPRLHGRPGHEPKLIMQVPCTENQGCLERYFPDPGPILTNETYGTLNLLVYQGQLLSYSAQISKDKLINFTKIQINSPQPSLGWVGHNFQIWIPFQSIQF